MNAPSPQLIKAPANSVQGQAEDPDRKFWEQIQGGLMMIVRAIAWRWLKKGLACKHCHKPL